MPHLQKQVDKCIQYLHNCHNQFSIFTFPMLYLLKSLCVHLFTPKVLLMSTEQ